MCEGEGAESSDPTQHAKGRTGDCPGPRKETTTRRNVTQGGGEFGFSEPAVRRRIPLLQNSPDAAKSDRITPAIFRNLSQFIAIFSLFFDRSVHIACPLVPYAGICCHRPQRRTRAVWSAAVVHNRCPINKSRLGQSHTEGRLLQLRRQWPALCGTKQSRQPLDRRRCCLRLPEGR